MWKNCGAESSDRIISWKIDFALSDGLGAYSDFLKEEVEKSDIQIILFSKTIALLLALMDFRKFP